MTQDMTTCGSFKCQREEQCDDCFMVDHVKECDGCEHYDHPVRKLEVQHIASDYPKQDSITSMTEAFFGFAPGTLSSKSNDEEGDRTAQDYADAEPVITE
jgi:hypothetical protein